MLDCDISPWSAVLVSASQDRVKPVIGWREWVLLPSLIDVPIKAKVDTGARTSALHASGLTIVERKAGTFAVFEIHPEQRSSVGAREVRCLVLEFRPVRSSDGRSEVRPVIRTPVIIGESRFSIEVTLTSRGDMGFRMLLGRSAVRRKFLLDPSRSFLSRPFIADAST